MKNFTKGVLVGVGIGLLFAPMKGEEMRRLLGERFTEFRNSLPEDSRMNYYAQQISERLEQTKGNLRNYAQQAASKVKDTGSTLGNLAQRSAQEVKQTGQDVASKAKEAASSTRPGSPTTRVMPETNNIVRQQ